MAGELGTREFWPFVQYDKYGNTDRGGYVCNIARGLIPGAGVIRQIGRNADVDNVREDAWESGGDYVFPADAGIQMRVVSTSANDAAAGSGARSVDIHYLDANGVAQETNVVLNGTTPVNTAPINIRRVNDFHVRTAGAGALAAGVISLQNTAGTVTYSTIQTGNGRHRQAVFSVPLGKIALINEVLISGNASAGGPSDYLEGYLRATCDYDGTLLPGIFNFKCGAIATNGGQWATLINPVPVPALGDIKMSIQSRNGTSSVLAVAGFAGWYEDT